MFEKLDKSDLKVLTMIANNPFTEFYLRELSKELKISPSTTKKSLDKLKKYDMIKEKRKGNLRIISGNPEEILFKQFKILLNIEKVKPIVEQIMPAASIILFGSYAKGENSRESDIDFCVISNKKNLKIESSYDIQLIQLTPAGWVNLKKDNPALAKAIGEGITMHGEKPS